MEISSPTNENKESIAGKNDGKKSICKKSSNKISKKLSAFCNSNSKSGSISERKGFSKIDRLHGYLRRCEVLLLCLIVLIVLVDFYSERKGFSKIDSCHLRLFYFNTTNLSMKDTSIYVIRINDIKFSWLLESQSEKFR